MASPPSRGRNRTSAKALTGPQADPAFAHLAAPEIRHRVRIARITYRVRNVSKNWLGRPVGNLLLKVWLHGWPGARWVEKKGLPRHNIAALLNQNQLVLHVNPRELIQFAMHPPRREKKRPSSIALIWDGDWDLRRNDLRRDHWIAYMRDLDGNRNNLERTEKYRLLKAQLDGGKPFVSHQEGIFLNTPERILNYLKVYLGFLDNMAKNGYDSTRAKDALGVVISREGRILKINRGLHRLAMAQWLGLSSIPVQVQHVHRLWWERVTCGVTGQQALQKMVDALSQCRPELQRGPLTEHPPVNFPDDFWPKSKATKIPVKTSCDA